ncbi:MAG: DUF5627 domain-containing protein [Bacteroidales bacterium]|nr:DUF5627 domain-containing protein [Bacteroidales bacterium]
MKKILIILVLFAGLAACENFDNEFADYKFASVYFPYQYPVRTLVLGDDIYDNTNDNNHKFLISAAIGGVYENKSDRNLSIEVDESLCKNVLFGAGADTIRLMPSSYYTISSNELVIPAGKYNGGVEVQLAEAFFDDPDAIKLNYVIPVRITGSAEGDSILSGSTTKASPDPRASGDWDVTPKNFTMFAVKFINPYEGHYLHRGVTVTKEVATNTVVETQTQHQTYITDDEVWRFKTSGKNQVTYTGTLRSSTLSGTLSMKLDFASDGTCTVSDAGSKYAVSGSGKFVENGDSWGNKKRNAIYLNFTATNGTNSITATDTLVIRDRGVVLETYSPAIFAK